MLSQIPSITFAIPVLNEEQRIIRCLDSIRNQEYPQDKVEIILADGGSTDGTIDAAMHHKVRVVPNPGRLAEFGLNEAMLDVDTDLVVVFAADNELVGKDWIARAASKFDANAELAALWGRVVASDDDPPINKYYALIQSEPLTFFANKNLEKYIACAGRADAAEPVYLFRVDPARPLPWGANGLVYRSEFALPSWDMEGYLGDNDAFQSMLARGHDLVAYMPELKTYHHSIRSLKDWKGKFERNFSKHFIEHFESRDMSWAFPSDFKRRLALWVAYSLVFPISVVHSAFLAVRDANIYWMYHPVVSLLQALIYIRIALTDEGARRVLRKVLLGRQRPVQQGSGT